MTYVREIAKFASGFEAFHALMHAYFWWSDTTISAIGVTTTPSLNLRGAIFAGVVSLALAVFAWRGRRSQTH